MALPRAEALAGPPTEAELALDMALPGRLTLAVVVVRVGADALVALLATMADPLEALRTAAVVVGLAATRDVGAWADAAGPTRRVDTAVRAVDTLARDDIDDADDVDDVDETLPAALVAPALLGTPLTRVVVGSFAVVVLPR